MGCHALFFSRRDESQTERDADGVVWFSCSSGADRGKSLTWLRGLMRVSMAIPSGTVYREPSLGPGAQQVLCCWDPLC